MNPELTLVQRLRFVFAEDIAATSVPDLVGRATGCLAYHVTPPGEDRYGLWRAYLAALEAAGYDQVSVSDAADLGDLGALTDLGGPEPGTLLAVALGGGEALPVSGEDGALGDPGVLLLLSPWSPAGWVSEEVCDHTSLMQLCEQWTAARGTEVRARLTPWRRRVCGDLVRALDLHEGVEPPQEIPGHAWARPAPYLPDAELVVEGDTVSVVLSNTGPLAGRAAHLIVDDGDAVSHHTVPGSPADRPKRLTVPVAVREGRYDVTVLGPNHFRRRFAGALSSLLSCGVDYFIRGRPSYPTVSMALGNQRDEPVTFTLTRRLGTHAVDLRQAAGTKTLEVQAGRAGRFQEDPWNTTEGWYAFAITADADPGWIQEYAGHVGGGWMPTIGY